MALSVGVLAPARSSVGGRYQIERLVAGLRNDDGPVDRCVEIRVTPSSANSPCDAGDDVLRWRRHGPEMPNPLDRSLDSILADHGLDVLLCPGSFVPAIRTSTVFWPLTVGPLEGIFRRLDGRKPVGRLRQQAQRARLVSSCRLADAFIFSSHYTRGMYGTLSSKVTTAPSVVIHPARPADGLQWSEADSRDVLVVGSDRKYSRLDAVIPGFLSTAAADDGARLRVAGRTTPANYSVDARIEYLGQLERDRLRDEYLAAACFVFGSTSENASSWSLIDAIATGVPCISTSRSSTPEIIGRGAVYVEPFDAPGVTRAIDNVLESKELRLEMSARAIEAAQALPTWADVATEVAAFLARV